MSITREQIRDLAEFHDAQSCAITFYFQPATPRNKAHREDTILVKDLAREALARIDSKRRKTRRAPTWTGLCVCRASYGATAPTPKPCSHVLRRRSGRSTICRPRWPVHSFS